MKTRIEIKGENHNEVRAFANILLTLIENNPAEYDSIVRVDDSTSFNQLTATFVAYQADRTEVDIKGLIAKAKETADAEEKEYDEIFFGEEDNYEEENAIFHREPENEEFTIEESREYWEIYSNLFGDNQPAATYDKENWTYDEAVENYRKYGAF